MLSCPTPRDKNSTQSSLSTSGAGLNFLVFQWTPTMHVKIHGIIEENAFRMIATNLSPANSHLNPLPRLMLFVPWGKIYTTNYYMGMLWTI